MDRADQRGRATRREGDGEALGEKDGARKTSRERETRKKGVVKSRLSLSLALFLGMTGQEAAMRFLRGARKDRTRAKGEK